MAFEQDEGIVKQRLILGGAQAPLVTPGRVARPTKTGVPPSKLRLGGLANGVMTHYPVDDLNPTGYPQVVDELTSGVVTRTYSYGLQRISEDQVLSNTWTPSFYSYDGGGSVRALTNTAGATTDTYEYDAFGNEFTTSGSTPNDYLYRGEQFDPDLGLYYLRARYYNPITGRFMSRDPNEPQILDPNGVPVDPKVLSKYLYTGDDPVDLVDSSGRDYSEYLVPLAAITATAWSVYKYGHCLGAVFDGLREEFYSIFERQSFIWNHFSCVGETWWGMNYPYPYPTVGK